MPTIRLVLTFPPEKTGKPITYHLVKDFDLEINIIKAKISPNEEGKLILDILGTQENIQNGLDFIKSEKIQIESVSKEIVINMKECIHCGACTAVCRPHALKLNLHAELDFEREKCIVCGLCVDACPLRIIEATF